MLKFIGAYWVGREEYAITYDDAYAEEAMLSECLEILSTLIEDEKTQPNGSVGG